MKNNTIFLDAYGWECQESDCKFKVILQGSYNYSELLKGYWYEVDKRKCNVPIKRIFTKNIIN